MNYTLYHNARFYTLDSDEIYDWLLSGFGQIIALGHGNDFPVLTGAHVKKVNLQGRTVIPAFTDAHTHIATAALYSEQISLMDCKSMGEALDVLKQYSLKINKNEWLRGGGYNKNIWKDRQPHKKHLDKIFPHNPVALDSKDGHSLWVNSNALRLAGINTKTADPPGGHIGRDADGQPDGMLYEVARDLIYRIIDKPALGQMERVLNQLYPKLWALGITSVHSMETIDDFSAFQALYNNQKLKIRINIYLPQQDLDKVIQAGLRSYAGNKWIRMAGIKFLVDGSLGSQTAEMTEPYENTKDYYGIEVITEDELVKRVLLAAQNGLSSAVHAIGDRAIVKTLTAFQHSYNYSKKFGLIQRIEHAQLVPPDQVSKFKQWDIVASMQPIHISDDVNIAEQYWGSRCAHAYPIRLLLDANVVLAFGSDLPIADPDPIKGIYSAVNRRYLLNPQAEKWHPELAISIRDAVLAYTTGTALATKEYHYKGTLTPGKVADFIVLNQDIFHTLDNEIMNVKVLKTILNGDIVYEDNGT